MKKTNFLSLMLVTIVFVCTSGKPASTIIKSNNLIIEVNNLMQTKVNSSACKTKPLSTDFVSSEYLTSKTIDLKQFNVTAISANAITDIHGKGEITKISGVYNKDGYKVDKTLSIIVYDAFPGMAFFKVIYTNTGTKNLQIVKWVNNNYTVNSNGDKPKFWSFQGETTIKRADWILPVDSTFSQQNFMGMNNTDYGGGMPLVDLWRKDIGIAIGHVEMFPKLVSLPVNKSEYSDNATIAVEFSYENGRSFRPGNSIETMQTFVGVHTGDCFSTLQNYSKFMQSSGIKFVDEEPQAFEPVWCSWGYWQKFTMEQVEGTLQKVKDMGFKWVDIDDGFQIAEGDWNVKPGRFPEGESAMRNVVNKIHAMGMKAKIWWAPLAVDPDAKLFIDNNDIIIRTKDNAPQYITGWESFYLSPTYSKTIDHTKSILKMFLQDWDFDGLKMDGMHINSVGLDYNRNHKLKNPTESVEGVPAYFKMVYDVSKTYKPNVVIQNCPCGACVSYFNIPYMNQAVASDPWNSKQTRQRAKVYKALRPGLAFYGDHIELSDGGNDFASQFGVGAVLGSKFTFPDGTFKLTPEKEADMKKWLTLYNQEMISKADYAGNLYDIGYDKPETHVIKKDNTLFYAFYANDWNGVISLRGLISGNYTVIDYENDKVLGEVNASKPEIIYKFQKTPIN